MFILVFYQRKINFSSISFALIINKFRHCCYFDRLKWLYGKLFVRYWVRSPLPPDLLLVFQKLCYNMVCYILLDIYNHFFLPFLSDLSFSNSFCASISSYLLRLGSVRNWQHILNYFMLNCSTTHVTC